jgi:hypothetical protein
VRSRRFAHGLTELLGDPHTLAANDNAGCCGGSRGGVGTPDAMPELPEAPMPSVARRFVLGSSTPRAALEIEGEALLGPGPDPIERVIVFGADESMQPHKVRADARGHRAISSDVAGASRWRVRVATVAGLIVLVDLVGRVLGSCGGAR